MNRKEFRRQQRARMNANEKALAKSLGLPAGFLQYAKRHGVLPSDIAMTRAKYPL